MDRRHFNKVAALLAVGSAVCSPPEAGAAFSAKGSQLKEGEKLNPDEGLVSTKKRFCLIQQPDGNLVEYFYGTKVHIWSTQTPGLSNATSVMQEDGNFVLYGESRQSPGLKAMFSSGTYKKNTTGLVLQDDGNCVIYDVNGKALWSSGRHFSEDAFKPATIEVSKETLAIMRDHPENPASSIVLGNSATAIDGGIGLTVTCSTTPTGVLVCTIATVLVAVALEFTKEKPFGPNNELRVLGGNISDEWKQTGREIQGFIKDPGRTTAREFRRVLRRIGL